MSNPSPLNHILTMGPTSSTVRNTGAVYEGNELKVIKKDEGEGHQTTRLHLNFNHKDEPTIMTYEGRMVYVANLNADDLLRYAHAVVMAQPEGSILELPFKVEGEKAPLMRVTKPFLLEITQSEAEGILYFAQVMVQQYDANRSKR